MSVLDFFWIVQVVLQLLLCQHCYEEDCLFHLRREEVRFLVTNWHVQWLLRRRICA